MADATIHVSADSAGWEVADPDDHRLRITHYGCGRNGIGLNGCAASVFVTTLFREKKSPENQDGHKSKPHHSAWSFPAGRNGSGNGFSGCF